MASEELNTPTVDNFDLPPEDGEVQRKKPRQKASGKWRIAMILAFMLAGVVLSYLYLALSPEDELSSSVTSVPTSSGQSALVGGDQATERYNELLEQKNAEDLRAAQNSNDSFVPTPVFGEAEDIGVVEEESVLPAPVRQEPVAVVSEVSAPATPAEHTELFAELFNSWNKIGQPGVQVYANSSGDEEGGTQEAVPANNVVASGEVVPVHNLSPGDMLYAVSQLEVNSDYPNSPVLAEIISGEYRGARLLGSFQRFEDRLIVVFNQLILPNKGGVISLTAYGVDPDIPATHLASSVDHHFLSRWGWKVAAGLGEGLVASARGGAGTLIESNSLVSTVQQESFTTDEKYATVVGEVLDEFRGFADENFRRAPTVTLNPWPTGSPIGILITAIN